jgi:hypothetical protein
LEPIGFDLQFIEKNSFNVRSAVYHLKCSTACLEFLLFPMVHVGSREFYEEVMRKLSTCDVIFVEGVNSKLANRLTLSYRVVKRIKRMGLVTQDEGMPLSGLRNKIVNPDMDGRVFDKRWSSLPIGLRAQMLVFTPIYAVHLFLFGTRETIAENIALEDLPSPNEIAFSDESSDRLDSIIIDERDRRLIAAVKELHEGVSREIKTIGVVYGAMHMRTLMKFMLHELNYRIAKAEWITIFDL